MGWSFPHTRRFLPIINLPCAVILIRRVSGPLTQAAGASLIFVVPCMHAKSYVVPPAFALSASSGYSISLNSLGGFATIGSGDGTLLLRIFEPRSDPEPFIECVFSHPDHTHVRLLRFGVDPNLLILASPKNVYPTSALILPILQTPSRMADVPIGIYFLASLLPNPSRFTLFSLVTLRSRFFDLLPESSDDTVSFTTSAAGSHLVVAPVHNLGGENCTWDASVLTPYIPSLGSDNSLPTPPASPTLRAIAHPATVPTAPIPSFDDIDNALTDPPVPDLDMAIPLQTRSPGGLLSLAEQNLAFALAILRALLHLLFSSFLGRSALSALQITPRRQGVLSDARTEDHIISDAPPQPVVPTEGSKAIKTRTSTPFFVKTLGGNVCLLLRSRRADSLIDDVVVECDSTVVDRKVKEIEEGVFYVEFDGGARGGQVKVSVR